MRRLILLLTFSVLLGCQNATTTGVGGSDDNGPEVPSATNPTVPIMSQELSIFSFGDWGTGDANQQAVATALAVYCQNNGCDFGLLLGDNFYESGVNSTDDPKWESYFETMYSALDLKFYAVLGNHDHAGNVQAQIDYTDLQDRWEMPARQYSIRFSQPGSPPLLEVFAIDSTDFDDNAATSLQKVLNDSNARWKILITHHPIYSNGLHGDTENLKTLLRPVICNDIHLVLAGHDHLFSHISDDTDGCSFQHLVAGTGGRGLYSTNLDPRAVYSESAFGFAGLTVSEDKIIVRVLKTDGTVPYSFQIQ